MVWWLFKKHKEQHSFDLLKRIENGLIHSFSLIKEDMITVTKKLDHHDNHIKDIHRRLDILENSIAQLRPGEPEIQEHEPEPEGKQLVWEDLTDVQQSLFWRLGTLQIEANQPWVSIKYLTEELYPNKDYRSVRSMISDYINILVDYGLLKKSRKGRQTYTALTKKGINFFDKNKQKRLLQLMETEQNL